MPTTWCRAPHRLLLLLAAASLLLQDSGQAASHNERPQVPAVRWEEERPGCTFSRGDDGRYHYGMWNGDLGINVAVDSQELEKVHRRHERFFAVLLNVRYKGQRSLDLGPGSISLEFVKHFHAVQTALDPDGFSQKVQNDADELNRQTAQEVKKHPGQKEKKEAYVRAFLKDSAELQEFVGKNSLRPTALSPSNPETTGWVLFSTSSKWIGGWKKPEELILRVPLDGKIFEFPFKLPVTTGEVILRRRP